MLSNVNKLCGRTSAFTFLFWIQSYPDSLDHDKSLLFDFLNNLKVSSCVSPLHDKDVNEINVETGEIEYKKAHFHIVIDFGSGSNKTVSQMFDLIEPIREYISIANLDLIDSSTPDLKVQARIKLWKNENCVKNMRSLLRYFKHLDNPEKVQYLEEDYHTFCGFDLDNRILNQEDSNVIIKDIKNFINNNEVYMFCDLVDYASENRPEWFSILTRTQYNNFVIQYMKSLAYKNSGKIDKLFE